LNDNESCAELLVDSLGDKIVNLQDNKGRTALHASALNDQVECLQFLLQHGGQINVMDHYGKTCVMMAAETGSAGAVELIVNETNVDLTLQDNDKCTALHHACMQVSNQSINQSIIYQLIMFNINYMSLIKQKISNQHQATFSFHSFYLDHKWP
ncbi:serine/threonine-protein phosphatase 6 regulatory ankyrin repeat subunit A-like, partial [Anneissia japonica]|uniref:serine/threonine-protein phosphatase 6 regulatory ankyrin repeat subunit A-like n=1 Tax=Anneissia japonica TaxID=1529436 RepID=UPI0014255D4E